MVSYGPNGLWYGTVRHGAVPLVLSSLRLANTLFWGAWVDALLSYNIKNAPAHHIDEWKRGGGGHMQYAWQGSLPLELYAEIRLTSAPRHD